MDISDVIQGENGDYLRTIKRILLEERPLTPKADRDIFNCIYMLIRIQVEAECLAKVLSEARGRHGAVLNDEFLNRRINYVPLFDLLWTGSYELREFASYMRKVIVNRLDESKPAPIKE